MNPGIADIRKDYKLKILHKADVATDPFEQFALWWQEAVTSQIEEVNAMTLATCTLAGLPSARIVLLKDFSDNGFVFFTNYNSHKAQELSENPRAALVFFWKELERQIRIEGTVSAVSEEVSEAYFATRPIASQIGAWASPQSQVITGRTVIEENEIAYRDRFKNIEIPKPTHWGGYIVSPLKVEFWQGRRSRLHDRILYTLTDSKWMIERLAP